MHFFQRFCALSINTVCLNRSGDQVTIMRRRWSPWLHSTHDWFLLYHYWFILSMMPLHKKIFMARKWPIALMILCQQAKHRGCMKMLQASYMCSLGVYQCVVCIFDHLSISAILFLWGKQSCVSKQSCRSTYVCKKKPYNLYTFSA